MDLLRVNYTNLGCSRYWLFSSLPPSFSLSTAKNKYMLFLTEAKLLQAVDYQTSRKN